MSVQSRSGKRLQGRPTDPFRRRRGQPAATPDEARQEGRAHSRGTARPVFGRRAGKSAGSPRAVCRQPSHGDHVWTEGGRVRSPGGGTASGAPQVLTMAPRAVRPTAVARAQPLDRSFSQRRAKAHTS